MLQDQRATDPLAKFIALPKETPAAAVIDQVTMRYPVIDDGRHQ